MEKKLNKKQQDALLKIAMQTMLSVAERGDLETRNSDSEDFLDIPVWNLKRALEEAYLLGKSEK
ncbi:DUF6900 domain-containing protein [Gemmiger formicilis]|jgi:hypothetical protein